MVNKFSLLERLLPTSCLLCGGPAMSAIDLCAACERELPWLGPACPRCALPLPVPAVCGVCQRTPPRFAQCIAAFRYAYPVRELLSRFKFDGDLCAGRALSSCLARRLDDAYADRRSDFLVVPVPLHASRLRSRGFNQAERIARRAAAELELTVSTRSLRRVRSTPDQKSLDLKARRANLRGAFDAIEIPAGPVALVDDVLTTGATANAAAAALLARGATEVHLWCLARTP